MRLFRRLCLLLALAAAPTSAAPVRAAPAATEERRILVMLSLPPPHHRGGAGYDDGYGDDIGQAARRRVAQGVARRHRLTLVDDWPMPLLEVDCFVMAVGDGRAADAVVAEVSRDAAVTWSQPLNLFVAQRSGDPLMPAQPAAMRWRLANLHALASGRGITVAVIDSRIDFGHPDLAGQLATRRDFVGGPGAAEIHGTAVAGIIAAREGNGIGIAGVAPNARLMALRACWQQSPASARTLCDSLSLAKAIQFAIGHGARIINLSLAGPPDRLLAALLRIALAKGAVVVAASDPRLPAGGFPASLDGVIAVSDKPAPGRFAAPGRDVPTTMPGGGWTLVTGSSYSAAHVSGLAALVRERRPSGDLRALFSASLSGGEIDACAALVKISRPCACGCARSADAAHSRPR